MKKYTLILRGIAIITALVVAPAAQAAEPLPSVTVTGGVEVTGVVGVDSQAMAVGDTIQSNSNSTGNHTNLDNTATIQGNFEQNARGNLGNNQAAGNNNLQSNSASLAAADANLVFDGASAGSGATGGLSHAGAYTTQTATNNQITYVDSTNASALNDSALQNVRGNLGLNLAAGDGNVQSNTLALGVTSSASLAGADNVTQQTSVGNTVTSTCTSCVRISNSARVGDSVLQNAVGNIGMNQAAGSGNMQANSLSLSVTHGQTNQDGLVVFGGVP